MSIVINNNMLSSHYFTNENESWVRGFVAKSICDYLKRPNLEAARNWGVKNQQDVEVDGKCGFYLGFKYGSVVVLYNKLSGLCEVYVGRARRCRTFKGPALRLRLMADNVLFDNLQREVGKLVAYIKADEEYIEAGKESGD